MKHTEVVVSWILLHGWSYGSMQRGAPRGIYCGEANVAKWRNLSMQERLAMDGYIVTLGNGTIEIRMRPARSPDTKPN